MTYAKMNETDGELEAWLGGYAHEEWYDELKETFTAQRASKYQTLRRKNLPRSNSQGYLLSMRWFKKGYNKSHDLPVPNYIRIICLLTCIVICGSIEFHVIQYGRGRRDRIPRWEIPACQHSIPT